MKPLIKWPGGKGSEINRFYSLIPDFDRYIEPFAGGAAFYFYLNPARAVLCDTSPGLMEFYSLVKEQDMEFKRMLLLHCRAFDGLKKGGERHAPELRNLFALYEKAAGDGFDIRPLQVHRYLTEKIALEDEAAAGLIETLSEMVEAEERGLPEQSMPRSPEQRRRQLREEYLDVMRASMEDKCRRTAANHLRRPYPEEDLHENLVCGLTSGFYLFMRNIYNDLALGRIAASAPYRAANFFFIREYCYGSMFRYNRNGEFNIPYGGKSYNRKDLTEKVDRMFSPETAALLRRTDLYCEDFETMLDHLELTENDFVFLDPPYDTEFSDYEGQAFTREDHIRLARVLETMPAKFLMVIKNTEFIQSLYEGKFRTLSFENRYQYNVRSRNRREAEHLILTNMKELPRF